jgi:hypothetical protein
MNVLKCILAIVSLVFVSCSEATRTFPEETTLANYVLNQSIETGAVIACAASDVLQANVLTFYYPEEGATHVRLYGTETATVDATNFSNYKQIFANSTPVFNGSLRRFTQDATGDKWLIVTFELDGDIKISNPIRSKQETKPTLWEDIVAIDQTQPEMPLFSWQDNFVDDNAIYFQVLTTHQGDLLSGTYTNENTFQYYKLNNVVLNITKQEPPVLQRGTAYLFTLMDVSRDNWVNVVTFNKQFTVE